jgi:hypothetical protein
VSRVDFARAFQASVELLARLLVSTATGLQQVAAAFGQNDGDVASASESDRIDQTLVAQVPQVAGARVAWLARLVAQVAGRHHPKRPDGRERARFGTAQRVLAIAAVVDDFSIAAARKIQVSHEDVTRIEATRVIVARTRVCTIA